MSKITLKILYPFISLFLFGCSVYPIGYKPYCRPGPVVNWKPNQDVTHGYYNEEYNGEYFMGNYYPPYYNKIKYRGPKGWQRGFNYPYEY